MALAPLETLGADLTRFTWVGAGPARGDAALPAHASALRALGEKIPALAKLAERVTALQNAREDEGPSALQQLALGVRQVLAAQASPVPPPVAPLGDVQSGLSPATFRTAPARALAALAAGVRSRKFPAASLLQTLESLDTEQDPRSWPLWIRALELDPWRACARRVWPRAPEEAVRQLEATFNAQGDEKDAHKLRALADQRRERGEALYRACLSEGSAPVQLAAIEAMRLVSAEAFDEVAFARMETLTGKAALDFVPLLGFGRTARSLNHAWEVFEQAFAARLRTGAAWDHFFERLDEPSRQHVWTLARTCAETKPTTASFAYSLDVVLTACRHANSTALLLLRRELESDVRASRAFASSKLAEMDTPESRALILELAGPHDECAGNYVTAFFRERPEHAYAEFEKLFPHAPVPLTDGYPPPLVGRPQVVLRHVTGSNDPRWLNRLLPLVDAYPSDLIPVVATFEDPRLLPLMLELAQSGARETHQLFAFDALAQWNVQAARPLMVQWLAAHPRSQQRWSVERALRKLEDAAKG